MSKSKWILRMKKAPFQELAHQYGIDQVIARIMINRDIQPADFGAYLHPSMDQLHDPHSLKDVNQAASILLEAIRQHQKIRIIGDYDIDGIQSVYILHQALLHCGADVDYAVPDRLRDGYGMNVRLVKQAHRAGARVLITCDNGIAAMEAIEKAKKLGMTVIITDHHNVPYDMVDGVKQERIPPADAVVDPKQAACPYPFEGICGAVVAWKLVQVLYEKAGFGSQAADHFIENAAFATVGDVMELVDENRSIVALGLEALRHTSNAGMLALMDLKEMRPEELTADHIGFILGPCFNASGRLDTATLGIRLLEAENSEEAYQLAGQLNALNDQRKSMTDLGVNEAFQQIDAMDAPDKVLVVYVPGLHESVAGIVAGRVREKYSRPALVLCDAADGSCVKGSGRSIEAYSMYDELNRCKDLLLKFGGHPMAAGLSLPRENVDKLRKQLNQNTTLTEQDLVPVIYIDVPMDLSYINVNLIRQLAVVEPCGNGNPKPVFGLHDVPVLSARRIGQEGKYLKFRLGTEKVDEKHWRWIEGLYFGDAKDIEEVVIRKFGTAAWENLFSGQDQDGDVTLNMLYDPQINSYREIETAQVIIREVC